jgi:Cu(I)/Ag(I) efflux system protein CusF
MRSVRALYAGIALLFGVPPGFILAQDNEPADTLISGVVQKVDLHSGRISIRHGPVKALGMTAAEAVDDFKVSDPIMLNAIQQGETITFAAGRVNGQLTIIRIVPR